MGFIDKIQELAPVFFGVCLAVVIWGIVGCGWFRLYQNWPSNGAVTNTSPVIEIPKIQGEPVLDIMDLGSNAEIIDNEILPLYNCNNLVEYQVDVQRSRQIEHTVNVEGQVESSLNAFMVLRLQGRYGIENRQTEQRSYTIHLTAPAKSWVEYTIEWRYVWSNGQLTLKYPDGTKTTYPYHVRSGMEFGIAKIQPKSCEP